MAHKVVVSGDALRDIENIHRYISNATGGSAADKIVTVIEEKIRSLAELSERGNWPKELVLLGITSYRELHFKPYRIIYEVEKDVIVYAVWDGRRDLDPLFQRRFVR